MKKQKKFSFQLNFNGHRVHIVLYNYGRFKVYVICIEVCESVLKFS